MKAYSTDLRERAVQAVEAGMSRQAAVRVFGMSLSTLKRLLKQRREAGHVRPKPQPGPRFSISVQQQAALAVQLHQAADATLEQHCQQWQEKQGMAVSISTMRRAIRRMNWTRKKRA